MPTVALWFNCAPDRPSPDNGVYRVLLGASPTPTTIDQTITPGVRDDAWIEISVLADPGDYVRVSYDREDGTRYYSNSVQPFPPAPLDSSAYTLAATVPDLSAGPAPAAVDSSAYNLAATVPDLSAGPAPAAVDSSAYNLAATVPDFSAGPDPAGDCDTVTVNLTGYGSDSNNIWWDDNVQLGSTFDRTGQGNQLLNILQLRYANGRVTISITMSNNRFTDAFEATGRIIITASDGETLEVMIANADMTEPYIWTPANSAEVIVFAAHVRTLTDQNATLTLTDCSPDAPLDSSAYTLAATVPNLSAGPAPAVVDSSAYTLAATVPNLSAGPAPAVIDSSAYTLAATVPDFSAGPAPAAVDSSAYTLAATVPDLSAGPAPLPGFHLFMDVAGLFSDQWGRVVGSIAARWGRQEAAHLARVLPLQMQVQLDNSDGRFDPEMLLPDARVEWNDGAAPVAHGRLASVRPSFDHTTGLRTATLHVEGPLALLNNGDHELSLFITDTIRTGRAIDSVLDQVNWPAGARRIDGGQVRIHPAHYTSVLAPRALHKAGPVLRAAEQAEVGLVHEERGNLVVFENRFHRELDPRLGLDVAVFGVTEDSIRVVGRVDPADSWDNIYNVVQVGADRAVVQVERVVYQWNGEPLTIPANTTATLRLDLVQQPQNRERDFVASVIEWADLADGDFEFHFPGGVDRVDVDLMGYERSTLFLGWQDNVSLGTAFSRSGAEQTLNVASLAFGGSIAGDVSLDIFDNNRRFTAEFESTGRITFTASDGRTLTVMIADADMTEPYQWNPTNSAEVVSFANHIMGLADKNATLTLTFGTVTNTSIVLSNRTRTGTTATIVNSNDQPIFMTKADLRGRGVALYGDLTIPELATPNSPYRRRVLELPTSFVGDGLNQEGGGLAEGNAYAALLLARYDHPQIAARLVIDPLADSSTRALLTTLQVSDPVLVQDGLGIPSGGYYVEGGDVTLDSETGILDFGIHVSRRGRRSWIIDDAVNVQPASVAWENVAAAVAVAAGGRYIVGAEAAWNVGNPVGSELPVMRVLFGAEVVAVWTENDLSDTPEWLAALVEVPDAGGNLAVQVQRGADANTPIRVTRWRVVRIES